MVDLEADDALAAAARLASESPTVDRIFICTPDKDLAQCVRGDRIVQLDRRKRLVIDEDGVLEKFGVLPASIPDYLALVGDSADGFPGLPGWGSRSAASILHRWNHLEAIPPEPSDWDVELRGAERLRTALDAGRDLALLFRDLATLRADAHLFASPEELHWRGPTGPFRAIVTRLEAPELADRAEALASRI
jgi:5'-3' exonuclease